MQSKAYLSDFLNLTVWRMTRQNGIKERRNAMPSAMAARLTVGILEIANHTGVDRMQIFVELSRET